MRNQGLQDCIVKCTNGFITSASMYQESTNVSHHEEVRSQLKRALYHPQVFE